jgi:uncharacterized membrane protein YozB (DUF420 family)
LELSTIIATVSLAIEVTVLALLTAGFSFKNKQQFRRHGKTMTAAIILHIGTILGVMVPSLVSGFSSPGAIDFTNWLAILSLLHASLGTIAALLGAIPVLSWRIGAEVQICFKRKKYMLSAFTLWVIAFLMGVPMYVSFYATRLLA